MQSPGGVTQRGLLKTAHIPARRDKVNGAGQEGICVVIRWGEPAGARPTWEPPSRVAVCGCPRAQSYTQDILSYFAEREKTAPSQTPSWLTGGKHPREACGHLPSVFPISPTMPGSDLQFCGA